MTDQITVEDYFADLPSGSRAAMETIRKIIKAAAPEAIETMSYRMPAFKDRGRILVYYAAFTDHYSIFPATDSLKAALGHELAPHLSGKGTIRFDAGEPLPTALVKKIVEARLAENAAARRRR